MVCMACLREKSKRSWQHSKHCNTKIHQDSKYLSAAETIINNYSVTAAAGPAATATATTTTTTTTLTTTTTTTTSATTVTSIRIEAPTMATAAGLTTMMRFIASTNQSHKHLYAERSLSYHLLHSHEHMGICAHIHMELYNHRSAPVKACMQVREQTKTQTNRQQTMR